jgi:hypothetical protein
MDAENDRLHDDGQHGDAGGDAAPGGSCLNMNPMFKDLPCMPVVKTHAERTREVATADNAERVVPALLAAIKAASSGKGRLVLLAMRKYNLIDPKMRRAQAAYQLRYKNTEYCS